MKLAISSSLLFSFLASAIILIDSCANQEDDYVHRTWDCDGSERDDFIGEWEMHSFGATAVEALNCPDTICPRLNLKLYEGGEYRLDYFMYAPSLENPIYASRQDTGTFEFVCEYNDSFAYRSSYNRINGSIIFSPIGQDFYTWEITEDSFWGLKTDMFIGGPDGWSGWVSLWKQ